ncbi:MAG: sulfatase-like hydrolase/transferase, partial [Acidobacteria bacterium]|nr:sulfatase-like hydrolase/transferase [Acidobacteriota bacterium]
FSDQPNLYSPSFNSLRLSTLRTPLSAGIFATIDTNDFWGNSYFNDTYWHNGKTEKVTGYCTDVFFNGALQFIEQNKHRPFFVYLAPNAPHSPYNVADHYSRPYRETGVPDQMANFYGMISNIDENLGRLRSRLKEWQLEESTVLIFMTDNGTAAGFADGSPNESIGASKWHGFNAGMRGIKGSEYDGGHRVPCFIYWPKGNLGVGRDVRSIAAHIDVLPTLIDLCRLERPTGLRFDGTSLVPLLSGNPTWPDRTLFVHSQRIEYPAKWRKSSVMTDRWRLVNGKQLYDMTTDAGQYHDMALQYPAMVVKLREAYESWWLDLSPRFNDYGYIVIGSEKEDATLITCQDWHAPTDREVPWNQGMIKSAPSANGYWVIQVARSGHYELTLSQQPVEANFPIQARRARLKLGDVDEVRPVPPQTTGVKFPVLLRAGKTRMPTWFTDEKNQNSRGAFFVYVRYLD